MEKDDNSDLETVKQFYTGWENRNQDLLKLSDDFIHISPYGSFNSKDEFLKECWKFSGLKFINTGFYKTDNCIKVTYELESDNGIMSVTEFVYLKDGLISKIEVKFGINS